MSIIFIIAFNIIFIPFSLYQSGTSALPSGICYIDDGDTITSNMIKIPDLPKRCAIYICGRYFFDPINELDDINMEKKDSDGIRVLVAKTETPVYMNVFFLNGKRWDEIFTPENPDQYDKYIVPLMDKIKDLGLSGIIFTINIFDNVIDKYAQKISKFIPKLKSTMPELKCGLFVDATYSFDSFSANGFDFTVTNAVIDLYIVKMHPRHLDCNDALLKTGTLITSPDPKVLTLDAMCKAIINSSMNIEITISQLQVAVIKTNFYTTYTEYCNAANNVSLWCKDGIQKLYDEGALVKKCAHGISSAWLDLDDYNGNCECGSKFPATNALFDGFDGIPVNLCSKLN